MLIDDLIHARQIGNVDSDLPKVKQMLRSAVVFELGHDFAATADALLDDYDRIAHAIPHCRLPYANCWFEVAQQHRPKFLAAQIHIPEIQGVPHRVGFLMRASDTSLTKFKVHQFWVIKGTETFNASHMAMEFDPTRERMPDLDPKREKYRYFPDIGVTEEWAKASADSRSLLSAIVQPAMTDFDSAIMATIDSKDYAQFLYEIGVADWSGENVYLMAALALLNTVNATESIRVDQSKINVARLRRNKPPLRNFYHLTISTKLRTKMGFSSDGHGRADFRAHMVRGHWKVRKTGMFFWQPHLRGDATRGVISKDYRLK